MYKAFALGLFVLAAASPLAAQAHYDFNFEYSGGGAYTLLGSSDNPFGTALEPGDSFTLTIAGAGGGFWDVVTGGFFFFSNFRVAEDGNRNVDYSMVLSLGGVEQYSSILAGQSNTFVHVGSNLQSLTAGLQFDLVTLSLLLNSSTSTTTIHGSLANDWFWPDQAIDVGVGQIDYVPGSTVPEPATMTLLATGLAGMVAARRKKRLG